MARRLRTPSGWAPPPARSPSERLPMLLRALRCRCPLCASAGLFSGAFVLRERCPDCRFRFRREDGYFTGAAYLTLWAALLPAFAVLLAGAAAGWSSPVLLAVTLPTTVVVPLMLARHLAMLWLWVDLAFMHPVDADDLAANDPPTSRVPRS